MTSEAQLGQTQPASVDQVAQPAGARLPAPPLPNPLPGNRNDVTTLVGSASRAAIGDFDGDGDREIVVCDAKEMRIVELGGKLVASAPVTGGIHKLIAADIDGDGHAEIFAGWGQTRDHMDTKARLSLHRLERGKLLEETVAAPDTSRNEVVSIVPMLDSKGVLFAYFDSKYNVTSVVAKRGAKGWDAQKIASLRTANAYARGDVDGDGKVDLVIGRVYGDDIGIDGDAFVLAPDGVTRTKIPSTRGLRSLAIADGDADGRVEIYMGDGWHQNYGENARGLLTWARYTNGAFKTELIEDTPGQYAIENIVAATIDGKPAIVAVGSHYVRVFMRMGAWRGLTISGVARDVAVGDLDGRPGDEILVVGDKSEIVKLRASDWSSGMQP